MKSETNFHSCNTRNFWGYEKLERARKDPSYGFVKNMALPTTSFPTVGPQNCERINFCTTDFFNQSNKIYILYH